MPALKVGDEIIAQSTAILEYLEEQYPQSSLFSTNPILKAQSRAFAQYIVSEMHAIGVTRVSKFLKNEFNISQTGVNSWQKNWTQLGFDVLEKQLSEQQNKWLYCFSNFPG